MTDQEILDLYFARDERAIHETANQYGTVCMQVSMNILHSRPDAEECVNDTYLKAWESIPPARPSKFKAYLCKIARNLSLNRYRYNHRACRNRDLELAMEELGDCIPAPAEASNALTKHLADFIVTLNDTDRRLFVGRYWYASSVTDLADTWGLTPNVVSVHLHRTREKLRTYLNERGYEI